jgi:hypothetical protein
MAKKKSAPVRAKKDDGNSIVIKLGKRRAPCHKPTQRIVSRSNKRAVERGSRRKVKHKKRYGA